MRIVTPSASPQRFSPRGNLMRARCNYSPSPTVVLCPHHQPGWYEPRLHGTVAPPCSPCSPCRAHAAMPCPCRPCCHPAISPAGGRGCQGQRLAASGQSREGSPRPSPGGVEFAGQAAVDAGARRPPSLLSARPRASRLSARPSMMQHACSGAGPAPLENCRLATARGARRHVALRALHACRFSTTLQHPVLALLESPGGPRRIGTRTRSSRGQGAGPLP